MGYQAIESYGLIGDLRTAALVGIDGSIDWLCLPHFDSPSVFAAILDDARGGRFSLRPAAENVSCRQFYWPDTNVLVTRFLADHSAAEITDFMPIARGPEEAERHALVRWVSAARGQVRMRMECRPAFDYARVGHEVLRAEGGVRFCSRDGALALGLSSEVPLAVEAGGATSEFELAEGESAVFVLRKMASETGCGDVIPSWEAEVAFRETVYYWRDWLAHCRYEGRWREMVRRSALVLKLLTFEPTGAIVAAPTTSLPEGIGGERNWDYRYSWIRDSAFALYALLRLGFSSEAERYTAFLNSICTQPGPSGQLQLMYGIDGRRRLDEARLDHLEGYAGSRPVRIGNAAYDQLQLDIYGELIDALYLYDKHGAPLSYTTWRSVRSFVEWVIENWRIADEGIWEVRGGRRHFVYSKLMCWVAIDRAVRIARRRSLPGDVPRWKAARDAIYEDIMTRGWNSERNAFVRSYGSRDLDAANLTMPLMRFVSPIDDRMLGTLEATLQPPSRGGLASNGHVYRYNVAEAADGLAGGEGTFNMCTFWLAEALARAGSFRPARLEQARLIFERMLGFASPLGLFAEETGPRGQALGNYPQAFTHLALISAAYALDRTLG